MRGASILNSASRSLSGVGRTFNPGTGLIFLLRKRPAITLIGLAHLSQRIPSLPVFLDVANGAAYFFFVAAVLDQVLRLIAGLLQNLGVADQVRQPQPRDARLFGAIELAGPA